MEATGYSRWFERLLAELGFELWIGDPAATQSKRVKQQKTDRKDAQLLLRLMRENNFPRIWVPSPENRTYVGMIYSGEGSRFVPESAARFFAFRFFWDRLNSYMSLKPLVPTLIHHTHSTLADFTPDLVMADVFEHGLIVVRWTGCSQCSRHDRLLFG
jgi:hypothetical protein